MSFNRYILLAVIIIIGLTIYSCSDTTQPTDDAVLFQIENIKTTPGNEWFEIERTGYKPDTSICANIKANFNPAIHKVYFYCSLTCGCAQKQLDVPRCIKAFETAGIAETYFEIYSMNKLDANQPHKGLMIINKIPSVFIVKNGVVVYSVLDTLDYYINHDNIHKPVEELILEGLKK